MPQACLPRHRPAPASLETYLRDINGTSLLNAEEEQDLAYRIGDGDAEARDHLVRANLRLVVAIASKYGHCGMDLPDLIAEGNLGLMRAAESFDPTMCTRFSTYAVYWIKQSIKRAIINTGRTIRIPAYMDDLLSKWRRAVRQLQDELDRLPTDEELAERLSLSRKKMGIVRRAIKVYNGAPQTGQEDQQVPLDEVFLDGRSDDADSRMVNAEMVEHVLALVDRLDERDACVLRLRFGLDGQPPRTLKEVGEHLGLTRERVRQIEKLALNQLAEAVQGE